MKAKQQSTVEPVFGILTQFLGMRKVNVRGLAGANKCMHMAATAYNLKKLLKYLPIGKTGIGKQLKTTAKQLVFMTLEKLGIFTLKLTVLKA